eukprot:TRINITY_DN9504_c0_g1_i16.p3 TRINITY_DN9504_c0_g1~~TRINITY_DN9504_c0_g1_i16.p3  ORF type:complete len:115 (+),score=54.83 TRINITY_DN9504_c0_g1_i16:104-448(+)
MADNKDKKETEPVSSKAEDEELLVSYEEEDKNSVNPQPPEKEEVNYIKNTVDELKENSSKLEHLRQNLEDEARREEKEQIDLDARSVFVKNVEYKTKLEAVSYTHLTLPTNREV